MSGRTVVPAEVVDAMRAAIAPLDTSEVRAAYRAGNFPRADRCKDRDMRYRWDLYWASGFDRSALEAIDHPGGVLDSHIDTALRAIVAPLEAVTA